VLKKQRKFIQPFNKLVLWC